MWILKFWRAMYLLHMDRTSDLLCQVWILIVKKYIRSFFTVSYRKVRSYQVPLKLSDLVLTAANKLQWNWMCCLAFRLYNKLQLLLHKLKNLFFFFCITSHDLTNVINVRAQNCGELPCFQRYSVLQNKPNF